MVFEREGCKPIPKPTRKQLSRELLRLRSYGPSAFASLTADSGAYVQVGGGGVGCVLEWRDESGRQMRASQSPPIVPFPDGAPLTFSGGAIPLRRGEWFRIEQVIEVFGAFLDGAPFPSFVTWRDVSQEVGLSKAGRV